MHKSFYDCIEQDLLLSIKSKQFLLGPWSEFLQWVAFHNATACCAYIINLCRPHRDCCLKIYLGNVHLGREDKPYPNKILIKFTTQVTHVLGGQWYQRILITQEQRMHMPRPYSTRDWQMFTDDIGFIPGRRGSQNEGKILSRGWGGLGGGWGSQGQSDNAHIEPAF